MALHLLIGPGSMTLAGGGEQREAGPGRAFFLTAGSGGWGAHTALATAVFLVFREVAWVQGGDAAAVRLLEGFGSDDLGWSDPLPG